MNEKPLWTTSAEDLQPGPNSRDHPELVIELHYDDGDVGAHPAGALKHLLWTHFSINNNHEADHIVIRRATPEEVE